MLVDALFRHAASRPDAVALVETDGTPISYRRLADLSSGVQARLQQAGVRQDDRVGVHLPKSADAVAAIYGILRSGATYVPVDTQSPATRVAGILADSQVRGVFTTRASGDELRASLSGGAIDCWELDRIGSGAGIAEWASPVSASAGPVPSAPESRAYILYTSGSTGTPKGVVISHGAAESFVRWAATTFELVPADRLTSLAPFHFDLSIFDLFAAHHAGAAAVLVDEGTARNPRLLAPLVAERGVTVWYSTPTALGLLLRHGQLDRPAALSPRLVLFAGEVMPPARLRELALVWPTARFCNLYGPTETNVCTWHPVAAVPPDEVPLPIGRPIAGTVVALRVDDRDAVEGETGEIEVSGPGVMAGYWNRAEVTQSAFRVDAAGTRWYRTGDFGRLDGDGVLHFHGRRDRMIKRHGYRVELGEIEHALARHPGVRAAAAVAQAIDAITVVHAFLVTGSARPSLVELKRHCAATLPAYMIPDRFHFVDALPETSTGKVDTLSLSQLFVH